MLKTPCKVILSIQMIEGNICEIIFKDHVRIELQDMVESFDLVNSYTNHKPVKKLVITGERTEITKEARLFGHEASLKIKHNIIAEAIHGNKSQNARQRALSNFKEQTTRVLVATTEPSWPATKT